MLSKLKIASEWRHLLGRITHNQLPHSFEIWKTPSDAQSSRRVCLNLELGSAASQFDTSNQRCNPAWNHARQWHHLVSARFPNFVWHVVSGWFTASQRCWWSVRAGWFAPHVTKAECANPNLRTTDETLQHHCCGSTGKHSHVHVKVCDVYGLLFFRRSERYDDCTAWFTELRAVLRRRQPPNHRDQATPTLCNENALSHSRNIEMTVASYIYANRQTLISLQKRNVKAQWGFDLVLI